MHMNTEMELTRGGIRSGGRALEVRQSDLLLKNVAGVILGKKSDLASDTRCKLTNLFRVQNELDWWRVMEKFPVMENRPIWYGTQLNQT